MATAPSRSRRARPASDEMLKVQTRATVALGPGPDSTGQPGLDGSARARGISPGARGQPNREGSALALSVVHVRDDVRDLGRRLALTFHCESGTALVVADASRVGTLRLSVRIPHVFVTGAQRFAAACASDRIERVRHHAFEVREIPLPIRCGGLGRHPRTVYRCCRNGRGGWVHCCGGRGGVTRGERPGRVVRVCVTSGDQDRGAGHKYPRLVHVVRLWQLSFH